ncbi:Transcriptional regulator, MerR family [Candidatus Burkholderia verschuerenii]|uniref:Transcriptional regulator, MerR family n=1 Tax=Candidatus Burkholderia verschuerenii TaxID=242163 RepID=A0A0L0MII2_9BURK|nr:Cd(II)/Pb(II)-responsive transcriptional regulator [Candidatus Burkholderia verschuerenii]KND62091.1 Transcriptional regulator, MerR family [Candidatus Burkholderia verschuerenii]
MKIGELARITNCTPDTIRFYEKEGLLPPTERTQSNYRTYDDTHVERMRLIRNCREFDMTHDEVRALLQAVDSHAPHCCAINTLIDTHIDHVRVRIDELIRLRDHLTALRELCRGEHNVHTCAILQELSSKETSKPKARKTHLG